MKPVYFKHLDALRFFAFLLVFWEHSFGNCFLLWFTSNSFSDKLIRAVTTAHTGAVGVHIFFVLSGFLITFLLIKELAMNRSVSVKDFYIRRIIRIWPLYYLILIPGIFVLPYITTVFQFCGNTAMNLLFLNNLDRSNVCYSNNVGVAWSVAIEEQFYLVWPLLFAAFFKNRILPYICAVLILLSSAFIITQSHDIAYFHTFGNINYLFIGCLGAIIYTTYQIRISASWLMKRATFITVCVITVLLISTTVYYPEFENEITIFSPVLYLLIIMYLVDIDHGSAQSFFSRMGKYTYGMYLYHPAILIANKIVYDKLSLDYRGNGMVQLTLGIISLAITMGVSILSYTYFEMYFLKYKSRFAKIKTRI